MERSDGKRIPFGVLYGVLALLFVWAAALRIPMTGQLLRIVFQPKTTVATPFVADWPHGAIQIRTRDLAERSSPPLERGDRIVSIEQRAVTVSPGDVLVVYSDGISEAMNPDEEEWGEARLAAAAAAASPCAAQSLIDRLFAAADAFASGALQHDDMTVVVVRMTA